MTKKVWYAPNKFESYGEEEIIAVENCLRDGWLAYGAAVSLLLLFVFVLCVVI